MLQKGSIAPDFSLPDQDGKVHSLHDYRRKWLLLYFYPKDGTSGCTAEACGLRDQWSEFQNANCAILGISKDPIDSHKQFAGKHDLPFPLLSDESGPTVETYGAWQEKTKDGETYMGIARISYLIDPQGEITEVYPNVVPDEHASEVLSDLSECQGEC